MFPLLSPEKQKIYIHGMKRILPKDIVSGFQWNVLAFPNILEKKTILLSSLPEPATSQVSPSPEIASPSFPEAQATYLGTTPDSFVFSCIKSISRSCRLHFQNIFRIWAQFYFLFLPSHFNKSQGLKMVLKPCMIHILQRSPLGVGLLSSLSPTPF